MPGPRRPQVDAANETWQLTVAPVAGFRPSWIAPATLAAAVSAALATALVVHLARGLCDCRGGGRVRPADDAERRLRDAEQRLRERLGITYRQGYVMGDERPPRPRWPPAFSWLGGGGAAATVRLRQAHVEAAARLVLRETFDVAALDGLYACLRVDDCPPRHLNGQADDRASGSGRVRQVRAGRPARPRAAAPPQPPA